MVAKRLLCTGILGAIMLCGPASRAERSSYVGAHAIPQNIDGRFCHIRLTHTHTYPPDDSVAPHFIEHEGSSGRFEFIGDPKDFGFRGPSEYFYGAHPIELDSAGGEPAGVCERRDRHAHLRAPSNPADYEKRNDTYYFGSYRDAKRAVRKARQAQRSVSRAPTRSDSKKPSPKPSSPPPKPKVEAATSTDSHRSWMNR